MMAQEEYEDEFDADEDPGSIKSLRRAANRAKKLEAELNEMKREVAFQRAGLPMDDKRMQYFVNSYTGELDEDSILNAAEEAGFIEFIDDEDEAPAQQAQQPAMDLGSQQRVMAASGGGEFENVTEQAALVRMQEALQQGGTSAFLAVAEELGIPTNNDE